jgi:acetyltransferase-like isoleucine patch superfamily enzyme
MSHDWFPRPLPANVVIGERSWLYSSFAFLHYRSRRPCGVRVGRDSGIYAGSFFDLGPCGEVEVGNFCTLVGAVIACDSRVVIEDYAFIAHEVVLADHAAAVPGEAAVGRAGEPPVSIVIGENGWVGARAVLLAGARVGRGAIVGAAAVVDFEVPPFTVVAGNPARVVGRCDSSESSHATGYGPA